jgi:restriction system protein
VKSPEEALEDAYLQFRAALEAELLEAVTSASPAFFEEVVVDLLVRLGWGAAGSAG